MDYHAQLIDKITETSVEVVDMILVLDISSSMLADDFQPNRLEAVKKTASILLIQGKVIELELLFCRRIFHSVSFDC